MNLALKSSPESTGGGRLYCVVLVSLVRANKPIALHFSLDTRQPSRFDYPDAPAKFLLNTH